MLIQISSWHDGLNTISPLYLLAQNQQNTWNMVPPEIFVGEGSQVLSLFFSLFYLSHSLFNNVIEFYSDTIPSCTLTINPQFKKSPWMSGGLRCRPRQRSYCKRKQGAFWKRNYPKSASTALKMSGSLPTPCFCICDSHCLQYISSPN